MKTLPLHLNRAARIASVLDWLRPVAAPIANKAEYTCWIGAHNADPDQSQDWCNDCASQEVKRLNAQHPEHEYFVDGGYGSDTDHPQSCCECGKSLDGYFTEYAIKEEADHYSRYAVSLRGKHAAERAYRFIQVFSSSGFESSNADAWRFFCKVERMKKRRSNQLQNQAVAH